MYLVKAVVFAVAVTLTTAAGGEPYRALREQPFFQSLGLQPRAQRPPSLTGSGIDYLCMQSCGSAKLIAITVAVHPNVALARSLLRNTEKASLGAHPDDCSYSVGEEGYLYGSESDGGTIRFRRENLTIVVEWQGPLGDVLPKIQQIDALIQNEPTVAIRGTFAEAPAITELAVPRSLTSEPVEVKAMVSGMGNPDALKLRLEKVRGEGTPVAIGKNHWGLRSEKVDHLPPVPVTITRPDGTRVTELKPITSTLRGSAIIRVMVANEDHVFVTRDFEVPVAP